MSEIMDLDARVRAYAQNGQSRLLFYIPEDLLGVVKSCPFCDDGEPYFWNQADETDPSWAVTCGACEADGPPGATLTEAFNAWNKRP